ncbi:hypothetical protein PTTG_07425 [Puccinia triticina 1-1 BBBD Race 1]|uniref:Zinc/iron permease n=1 Tax=Puccinia triticina (isolate 1-1 / race 1 (BBBD)) TaxID=630390 RepID=A0A180GA00_PUCT1|nr:hypothetical protein PTTG_07425 [Puccinia triticina 1-1 BBBD Race 1]
MAFLQLFILVTVMAITTFFLGSLPLSLSTTLSPVRFHQLSIFSVGLLIGAALTIVIPEGIDTIYNSAVSAAPPPALTPAEAVPDPSPTHHHHSTIGLALMGGFMLMFLIDQLTRIPLSFAKTHADLSPSTPPADPRRGSSGGSSARAAKLACSAGSASQTTGLLSAEGRTEDHGLVESETQDRLAQGTTQRGPNLVLSLRRYTGHELSGPSDPPEEHEGDDDEEEENEGEDGDGLSSAERGAPESGRRKPAKKALQTHSFATVIGLLTHSVADGIALGASSSQATTDGAGGTGKGLSLALIIFLAIMVHKAPAAFGMVMVLLAEGLAPSAVRKILAAFSLAAPVGAMTTWAALTLVHRLAAPPSTPPPGTTAGRDLSQWWIGVTLLFSAGTFLFVATHALQNTSSNPVDPCCPKPPAHPSSRPHDDIHPHPSPPRNVSVGPLLTCALMVSGMCFPWSLTQLVGAHHH